MAYLRMLLSALVPLFVLAPVPAAGLELAQDWQWPLSPSPTVVAPFVAPTQQWSAGHRGIDLAGSVGQPVFAVATGAVSFAGVIAGRGVVVVDHGELRSTYQPVLARVHAGETVAAGQVIGTLEAVGSHCLPAACLHLGIRRGEEYVDPLALLEPRAIRLESPGNLGHAGGTSSADPALNMTLLLDPPPASPVASVGAPSVTPVDRVSEVRRWHAEKSPLRWSAALVRGTVATCLAPLGSSSGSRVRLLVRRSQPLSGHVGVQLGRRQ